MKNEKFKQMTNFIDLYFSTNQTPLVEELFKLDKTNKMINHLSNYSIYKASLSAGDIILNEAGLNNLIIKTGQEINFLHKQKATQQVKNKIKALKRDIIVLENAEPHNKFIYEWYLVPFWLAEQLILKDEVVLKYLSSNWWGRCTTGQFIGMDKTVQDLATSYFK